MAFRRARGLLIRMEGTVTWKFFLDPEDNVWLGVCEALNLNAEGETTHELQQCANEAMALLFKDLFKDGELVQFMRDRGFSTTTTIPQPGGVDPTFDVPSNWKETPRSEMFATA